MTLTRGEGLIPFLKLMQINKIVHPRLKTDYLEKRRALYKAKDWKGYDECVRKSFSSGIEVA